MPKIKKVNMRRTGSRLPSGYQEVEYIQSTPTNPGGSTGTYQCIDTGYKATANTEISLDAQLTNTTDQSALFGATTSNSSYLSFLGYIHLTYRAWYMRNGVGQLTNTNVSVDTNRHTFVINKSTYKLYTNGVLVYSGNNTTTPTTNGNYNLFLFCNNGNGTAGLYSSAKLYSCKIYESGTLVRNFVPCYRTNDNVIGMYDLVYGTFYTNSGTGTFTKGDDVSIVEHQIWPVFKYSYDFRNKTVAQLQNDGWLNVSSATVSANGIYTSGWTSVENNVGGLQKALSTAKKLILKCDAISQGGVAGGFLLFDSSRGNQTGMYANIGSTYKYVVNVANDALTTSSYNLTGNISTTYILDFENKILNYTFGSYKGTYSVTDTQLSKVRQCCTIYCPIDKSYMKDVSILIEQYPLT